MAKIDVTKTELVWPGKYNEDGTLKAPPRTSLPFQVIEAVNGGRIERVEPQGDMLYQVYQGEEGDTFDEGWKNKLIWGDNLLVMGSLLEKFAGKIDLIYIDPPFATGADFSFSTQIGESGESITKQQSAIEEKAYRDTFGENGEKYPGWLYDRVSLAVELLKPGGSIVVHLDWRATSIARHILDEVMGPKQFRNEIIWCYHGPSSPGQRHFNRKHDTLWWFSKPGAEHKFDRDSARVPYDSSTAGKWESKGTGFGGEAPDFDKGKISEDWWRLPIVSRVRTEITGYPTQKPEALLKRLISSLSEEDDLVADFFCGSGTTLAVAEKLARRWIGCDLGRWAIHTTRKRLLEIKDCKPFEIMNLGKYERQYWQGVTFNGSQDKSLTEQALYEYLVFILKLYKAQPVPGMAHLHGRKGKAMVHIGAVDAPVTIGEVNDALDECERHKQKELHVLGWEWEMGLAGPNNGVQKGSPMHGVARQRGVKLRFLQIPREVMEQQAADKGDVRFFELAYLKVGFQKTKQKLTARVKIEDFVIPNSELIPEEVKDKIKGWSDYIDYWAVDWNFRNRFVQGFVSYRTRKERTLSLKSATHTYKKPGKYPVLVKVIDIFGNDTSQLLDVKVK